jgi:ankyrin repeat protein
VYLEIEPGNLSFPLLYVSKGSRMTPHRLDFLKAIGFDFGASDQNGNTIAMWWILKDLKARDDLQHLLNYVFSPPILKDYLNQPNQGGETLAHVLARRLIGKPLQKVPVDKVHISTLKSHSMRAFFEFLKLSGADFSLRDHQGFTPCEILKQATKARKRHLLPLIKICEG